MRKRRWRYNTFFVALAAMLFLAAMSALPPEAGAAPPAQAVSYTHLTLPTILLV